MRHARVVVVVLWGVALVAGACSGTSTELAPADGSPADTGAVAELSSDLPVVGPGADAGDPGTPPDLPWDLETAPDPGVTPVLDATPDLTVELPPVLDATPDLGPPPCTCNDGDPCTVDGCDASGGCQTTPAPTGTPCDDGNLCTVGESCTSGTCGGGEPKDCEDGKLCTTATCEPAKGCLTTIIPDGTLCDDLSSGTSGDVCALGVCVGVMGDCTADLSAGDPTMKIVSLAFGDETVGVDLTGDGKVDNAMSFLGGLVNAPIQQNLDLGTIVYLLHLPGFSADAPFALDFFLGDVAPQNASCDFQKAACDYLVSAGSFEGACAPVSSISSNTWNPAKKTLTTVTPGEFLLTISLGVGNPPLEITVHKAQVTAALTFTEGAVSSFTGQLGGAVKKTELATAAAAVAVFAPYVEVIKALPADVDLDANGTPESLSVGLLVAGVGGTIVGVLPK